VKYFVTVVLLLHMSAVITLNICYTYCACWLYETYSSIVVWWRSTHYTVCDHITLNNHFRPIRVTIFVWRHLSLVWHISIVTAFWLHQHWWVCHSREAESAVMLMCVFVILQCSFAAVLKLTTGKLQALLSFCSHWCMYQQVWMRSFITNYIGWIFHIKLPVSLAWWCLAVCMAWHRCSSLATADQSWMSHHALSKGCFWRTIEDPT